MKYLPLYAILLLIIILSGCKTTPVLDSDRNQPYVLTQETVTGELRGFVMPPELIGMASADIFNDNISIVMKKAAEANYNIVFIPLGKSSLSLSLADGVSSSGFQRDRKSDSEPLKEAVKIAHQHDLKICVVFDLAEVSDDGFVDFPDLKAKLKKDFRKFIESYNIDGLSFDLTGFDPHIFREDSLSGNKANDNALPFQIKNFERPVERLKDLIEDILVEVMLVKPYLLNSIVYTFENEQKIFDKCLREGIIDFIVARIGINNDDVIGKFETFFKVNSENGDVVGSTFPLFSIPEANIDKEFTNNLAAITFEYGFNGILFSQNLKQNVLTDSYDMLHHFSENVILPGNLKKVTPKQIVGLNVSTLLSGRDINEPVYLFQGSKVKMPDSNGKIGFVIAITDTIEMKISERSMILPMNRWSIPFKYAVNHEGEMYRESPWVEFRQMPEKITDIPEHHLLCKTDPFASAWINGDSVKVYKTGIFFNRVTFEEGANRIRASIMAADTLFSFYEREFIYEKTDKARQAFPLWIDERSIEPGVDLELLPQDVVQVSFQGSAGQVGFVELYPGGILFECQRTNFNDYSLYRAEIPLSKFAIGESYQVILRMMSTDDTVTHPIYEFPLQTLITVRTLDDFPLVRVVKENSRLTYNTGPIRLGGPIRSEFGPGIKMKVSGKIGENFRIRLNQIEEGMIPQEDVVILPDEAVQSSYFITSISCTPGEDADQVSIPYPEPIPYEVYPDPDQSRIVITLYGAKTSSTWITHRAGRKVIDKITWQQTAPDTYQVYVNLKTSEIWGYDLRPDGKSLLLKVKYPPVYDLESDRPLNGLKIAIEAGHGGVSTGAVGLSGLLEKDINLDLSLKLGNILRSMGAEVLQVRESDITMSLFDKRNKAITSEADLLISIHANAAGTSRGYLGVPGTSTYYNNPFWAPLAEDIYDQLLELGLEEFGVVGSFNYTVIRVSQMPSILVEQAFLTHAEDEEKLADPEFRQRMATKIYDGLVDYLSSIKSD